MEEQQRLSGSSKSDATTWVILAGLLVLGFVIGVGGIALANLNEQGQMATTSEPTPSAR
jgi:hypothetical protein